MSQILIGCDPEVFVRNPNSKQFVTAHNMIPGTKKEPFKVKHGAVQVDGMALEFNIDPAASRSAFVGNVKRVYHELEKMVPGYELVPVPVADFDPDYFIKEVDAQAKELGCDPDYNAYTGKPNVIPPGSGDRPFRTASGHVHIGWTEDMDPMDPVHFEDCRIVARQLDFALGLQSLQFDKDNRRRSLYGKAGAFRPKPYGVEYRTLSNRWLTDDRLIAWVYDATVKALDALDKGHDLFRMYGNWAQRAVDQGKFPYNFNLKIYGIPHVPDLTKKKAA